MAWTKFIATNIDYEHLLVGTAATVLSNLCFVPLVGKVTLLQFMIAHAIMMVLVSIVYYCVTFSVAFWKRKLIVDALQMAGLVIAGMVFPSIASLFA
jgi:hypothetical protein